MPGRSNKKLGMTDIVSISNSRLEVLFSYMTVNFLSILESFEHIGGYHMFSSIPLKEEKYSYKS